MTNREFARDNVEFRQACEKAGVSPTRREASRFRMKKGAAYAITKRQCTQSQAVSTTSSSRNPTSPTANV